MKISEILKGTIPGELQSVGYMQVIPLVSDLEDNRFGSPADLQVGTKSYGSMEFKNDTSSVMIVPLNAGYVVRESAQDHAMMGAGLIGKNKSKTWNDAACIQESQGGMISGDQHEMLILPYSLREAAMGKRGTNDYSKLWPDIANFNASLGCQSRGHLEDFLNTFRKQLDLFVAEFEIVPKQIGAIVLINGQVVGVERAPSHFYFLGIWKALIRECYGSLALEVAKNKDDSFPEPKTRVVLDDSVSSLEELLKAVDKAKEQEFDIVKDIVRDFVDEPFDKTKDQSLAVDDGELVLETIKNKQFTGQMVTEEDRVLYASLITTNRWNKTKDWHEAKEFAI